MSKEKPIERQDNTTTLIILNNMKSQLEISLKFITDNVNETKDHVKASNENQIKIQDEMQKLYLAIVDLSNKQELFEKRHDYEINEIKESIMQAVNYIFDQAMLI